MRFDVNEHALLFQVFRHINTMFHVARPCSATSSLVFQRHCRRRQQGRGGDVVALPDESTDPLDHHDGRALTTLVDVGAVANDRHEHSGDVPPASDSLREALLESPT